jgi:hypothetical protein
MPPPTRPKQDAPLVSPVGDESDHSTAVVASKNRMVEHSPTLVGEPNNADTKDSSTMQDDKKLSREERKAARKAEKKAAKKEKKHKKAKKHKKNLKEEET